MASLLGPWAPLLLFELFSDLCEIWHHGVLLGPWALRLTSIIFEDILMIGSSLCNSILGGVLIVQARCYFFSVF